MLSITEKVQKARQSFFNNDVRRKIAANSIEKSNADTQGIMSEMNTVEQEEGGKPYRTPKDFKGVGDGLADDTQAVIDCMTYCAANNLLMILDKKYTIKSNVEYLSLGGLHVIGTKGAYNNLTSDMNVRNAENCDLFFDGGSITINKLGSVVFENVGFSGKSKTSDNCIIIKSFHCKFIACNFSQFNKALSHADGALNWLGENQFLFNTFTKCTYAFWAENGTDSEFIGNIINSWCDYGFYGQCSGFLISNNHFYNKYTNKFTAYNTEIVDNYFPALAHDNAPAILIDGSFSCNVTGNRFLLGNDSNLSSVKAVISIDLDKCRGQLNVNNNAVNGVSNKVVKNLAFIGFKRKSPNTNSPLNIGNNLITVCEALFDSACSLYYIDGAINFKGVTVGVLGGTVSAQSAEVINGIANVYVCLSKMPAYADVIRLPMFNGIPIAVTVKKKMTNGSTSIVQVVTDNTGKISINDYGAVASCEIYASYIISHGVNQKLHL